MIVLSQYPANLREFQHFLKKKLEKRHAATNAFSVFFTIYARCGKNSDTFVSLKRIVNESLCGRDATLQAIADLIELSCLTVKARHNEKGGRMSNLYTISQEGIMIQFFEIPQITLTDEDADLQDTPPPDDQDTPPPDDQDSKLPKNIKTNSNSPEDWLTFYRGELEHYASKQVRAKGSDYEVTLEALARQIADLKVKGQWEDPVGKTTAKAYQKFVEKTTIRSFQEKKARKDVIREEEKKMEQEAMTKYHTEASQVMAFVNSLIDWHIPSDEGYVSKLLYNGFVMEEICLVAAEKIYAWGTSEKMRGNVKPYSLFGPSFEGSLNSLKTRGERTFPGGVSYYSYLCRVRNNNSGLLWDNMHFSRSFFYDFINPSGSYKGEELTIQDRYELAIRFTDGFIERGAQDGYRNFEAYAIDRLPETVKRNVNKKIYQAQNNG